MYVKMLIPDNLSKTNSQGLTNWRNFLLPAGHSETLGMRFTQSCNYDWDTSSIPGTELSKWHSRNSAFADKNVLFVGERFVPYYDATGKGKIKVDGKREASSYLPKVALALGARSVEAVTGIELARNRVVTDYDYIVRLDGEDPPTLPEQEEKKGEKKGEVKHIDVNWLKDYLVSGIANLNWIPKSI